LSTHQSIAEVVGAGCAEDMRAVLGLVALPETVDPLWLLGVNCKFNTFGFEKNSSLLILCARPLESESWDFGNCFPLLPGGWQTGNSRSTFHLRFLSLKTPLWLYVWTRHPNSNAAIETALLGMPLYQQWLVEMGGVEFAELGLEERDLQSVPRAGSHITVRGRAFGEPKPSAQAARVGLFMWGHLPDDSSMTQVVSVITSNNQLQVREPFWADQLDTLLDTTLGSLLVKARVRYEEPGDAVTAISPLFRHLVVQMPAKSREFGSNDFKLENAGAYLSSPIYFSPKNSRVGVKGDFKLSEDKRIHVDLDFPIHGDVIRATGKYIGSPEHLLGESASFGLPGPAPSFGADTEICLELEFSKSRKTLTKLKFDLELRDKDWTLLPAPILIKLEGVAFKVTVYEPLSPSTRTVVAQIAAEASFGDGDNALRLVCGGSYPSGDLYLQAQSSIPVGSLLEKMIGPSPGLEKLTVEDLRLDYNYRQKYLSLQFNVPEKWAIVEGFEVGELRFRIQGGDAYSGSLAAVVVIAQGTEHEVDVSLAALYDQGWQFQGSTGLNQKIPIGKLLSDLGKKFGIKTDAPACLDSLEFKNLAIAFNTVTKDFTFKGEADFKIEDREVAIEVSIDIGHQSDGTAHKRFSGVIKVGASEFNVVFDDEKLIHDGAELEISTLLAAYRSTGEPPSIRDLVPTAYKQAVPDNIKTKSVFLAKQWKKPGDTEEATTSKWLLGLSLEAGLDLSNVKLPNLPLMGSGGPPKSLKLDLQVLVATKAFNETDLGIIESLNATGGVSIPTHGVESVAVATVLHMDGKIVTLNLPVKINPESLDDPKKPAFVTATPTEQPENPAVTVTPDNTKWVKVQKKFGPIHVERVGLKYQNEKLFIYLDGGLTAAGFTLSLYGLGVDTPLTELDPHFHISGIGIDYKSDSIELGGAFLKQQMLDSSTGETYDSYAGEAVLRTEQLSLSAIGSYMKYQGETSLFVYALLEYPLGGPPFFFVTGLAAGFGYNRRAIIPRVENIHTYPLVSKAIAGPVANVDGPAKPDLAAELAALNTYVPAALGEAFLAVGVKFSSFELIDSFGLIIAQFGNKTQFDLLGVSHLQIPSKAAGGKPGSLLAEIFMNWKAIFRPDEGVVGLKASLAPGSYVFSRDCHLTGQFAYYAWFSGEHAGDFVYTVGGYHPDFKKPAHYPRVERLEFNWLVTQANLQLKGQLYYALTGHAFMAGGKLDASMHGGFDIGIAGVDYRADLHIAADFLITWEPFHYDAAVKLDLNIDISAHLLFYSTSFSLEVAADMHLWGPEFAGRAEIYLKVIGISHTLDVKFGHGPSRLRPITWEKFSAAFLPKADSHSACGVSVKRGLLRASGKRWVINAKDFCLVTDSVVPINKAVRGYLRQDQPEHTQIDPVTLVIGDAFLDPSGKGKVKTIATDFGIAPMGVMPEDVTTVHSISITREDEPADKFFRCEPVYKNVPAAMWDKPRFDDDTDTFLKKPKIKPKRQLVSNVLGGFEVLPAVLPHPMNTLPLERGELLYETDRIADAWQWGSIPEFVAEAYDEDWKQLVSDTIPKHKPGSQTVAKPSVARENILRELGIDPDTIHFGQPADQYMLDAPQIGKNRHVR
jgi:hypothetical protein